ncbi:MAG: HAD family hydrolase [Candidatus Kariarchaeaceae archaeon]|jgi:FMN phosphatase YigB (HAD superfamily)
MSQPVLFIDLHGVLVNTPKIFDEYRRITVEHLIKHFPLNQEDSEKRYDRALALWEKEAFDYLRNPLKKKVGKEFLDFLENCDKLFPRLLYEGLDIDPNCKELRTRPFEYAVASKVEALYPEVLDTLQHLINQGYEMYVASSSHSSHIDGIMDANNLNPFFEKTYGFDTVAATKHTLKYYKNMLSRVRINPKSSVMVGNSMHEILKPRKLGMKTIHINRERKVPQDVRRLADRSLKNLSALPAHLDTLQIHS